MSQLEVNKIIPQSGTTLTIGETGDTISFASGVLPALESLTITGDLTVNTDALKVDSTNKFVGIGTASPAAELDIQADVPSIQLTDTDGTNQIGLIYANAGNLFLQSQNNTTNGGIGFRTYDGTTLADTVRIDSSGRVGISTTSPQSTLDIGDAGVLSIGTDSGDAFNTNSKIRIQASSTNDAYLQIKTGTADQCGILLGDTDDDFLGGMIYYNDTDELQLYAANGVKLKCNSAGGEVVGDLEASGEIIANDNGSNDGGAVIRAWNTTSAYAMFGTANMVAGSEYAVITDGTNTYIGGGAGGSVYIRNGANDSNPQIQVGSSQINMTGKVDFSSNLVLPSNAQIRTVSGQYGNFQVDGGGTVGGYDGLNVNGHTVFMSNGSRAGIYNDTNNEWLMYGDFNSDVALFFNGAMKLQTTSSGVSVTGTLSATTLSGAGVYTAGSVANSNNSNGYIRFANNLIIQWVRKSVGGTQTITLPTSMNRYYGAYTGSQTSGNATLRIHSLSTTQVVVGNRDGNITGWVLVYGRKT